MPLAGGGSRNPERWKQTVGSQDCRGRRRRHSYEGGWVVFQPKNIKTLYFNIKIFKCCAGGESPWDRHSSIQGRPEVRGRVGGGAGGADHHDDPPTGQPLHVPNNP